MKKFFAILMSLALMLSLALPAMAANADLSGHTYTAYKIFSGTQAAGEDELGNIDWGDGVDGAALLAALKADNDSVFADCANAMDVADVMAEWADDSENAKAFAKLAYAHKKGTGVDCENGTTPLEAGYYLVVDITDFDENEENTVYNLALLQLTNKGTFVIANKTSVPSVVKKVKDINDSTETELSDWQDSADHDIGDDVHFQLKATLADNVESYSSYKVVFHDTLSKGLTYKGDYPYTDTYKVYLGNDPATRKDVTEHFSISVGEYSATNGTQISFTCNDVKDFGDFGATNNSVIVVEYTATLNTDAVIGAAGNPNKVYLEYSNNPNWTPDTGDGPEDSPTGKTPEDKVIVFTYKVIANKVHETGKDEKGEPIYGELPGAGFTLYKKNAEGVYEAIGDELKVDENENELTTFEWVGLDDGDYKLSETTTPPGYNTIADILFTISAEHDETSDDPKLTKLEGGDMFTGEFNTDDILSANIINNSGTTLPETGGMGTTIFYAVGGVMVAAAAILLITKKRMSAEG